MWQNWESICVRKSTSNVTGMAQCDFVLWVDDGTELKGKYDATKIDELWEI